MYDDLSDAEIVARTAFGENRGGGAQGMQSVINVISNRANSNITWWGVGFRGVCLKYEQFDCWLPKDPNYQVIMNVTSDNTDYASALDMATQAIAGTLEDITNGATYYYAASMPNPPSWANGHVPIEIAGQLFFNDIDS